MGELLLGPMLRHVSDSSATIFVETDTAASVDINGTVTSTFEVAGHHYALIIMEGLPPASMIEYSVLVDGECRWPLPDSSMPPSVIRTLGHSGPLRLLFGSCRAAAPHEPPFSLSATDDPQGLGVDSLRAHGLRMLSQDPHEWPDMLMLLGDQIYADEPSPETKKRMRSRNSADTTPALLVGGFEEYTWLYRESWTPEVERWLFTVVPTAMIFDDHELIDDWNISGPWVHEIRLQPWWQEHVTGCLIAYWIYQHLGNLSPQEIRDEAILGKLMAGGDGATYMREWAAESERFTPREGGYRFSFVRHLGRTRLVVIDCRNGRNLEPERAMVGAEEWKWIDEQCRLGDVDHLLLATSLPVMVPGGLDGLEAWNAALCGGKWGKWVARGSERIRRYIDLEDWPAFDASLRLLLALIDEIRTGPGHPATISILSGDIHFSYVARADFAADRNVSFSNAPSRVYQLVSSPIRQSLPRRDRLVIRFAMSRIGQRIGGLMTRSIRSPPQIASWTLTDGPAFANEMSILVIDGENIELMVERARPDDNGSPILETVIHTRL